MHACIAADQWPFMDVSQPAPCQEYLVISHSLATYTASPSSAQDLVDVDIFLVCQRVEDALRAHDTAPCLSWCHDNRSKLRRLKSTLEFQVRLQEFIELVREDRQLDAIRWV